MCCNVARSARQFSAKKVHFRVHLYLEENERRRRSQSIDFETGIIG